MVTRSSKKKGGLSPSSSSAATSPTSTSGSNGKQPPHTMIASASKEGETTAEFRRLVVQEQVRSLRRRLWHAFQNEDAVTALRAYKATARDLQAWIREEIDQAKEEEERRQQEEKVKKEAQRPTMMKKLSLGSKSFSTSTPQKQQSGGKKPSSESKSNRLSFRKSTGSETKSKPLFGKMKKPPAGSGGGGSSSSNTMPPTSPFCTPSEAELIMSTTNKEGNENPLLPLHMNPSEPFLLDDYKDPSYEIDPVTGEARSVASMGEQPGSNSSSPTNQNASMNGQQCGGSSSGGGGGGGGGRHFRSFRKRNKNRNQQEQQQREPRTPTSSFWASLKLGSSRSSAREAAAGAATLPTQTLPPDVAGAGTAAAGVAGEDPSGGDMLSNREMSESTDLLNGNNSNNNPNDLQAIALTDPRMTTPLHEAARLGNAELVRLMLKHPFVEPNFKNGLKRTALHMVAGGWTESEERLWRTLQRKNKAKLNHKNNKKSTSPSGSGSGKLKTTGLQVSAADLLGISSPIPVQIDPQDGQDGNGSSGRRGAKKAAAKAMSRFFHTTFSKTNGKDGSKAGAAGLKNSTSGNNNEASAAESQGYLVWDENMWNDLKTERFDCLLAILSWQHPDDGTSSAGENASVNAVDGQGRTALHYAAELGREDICMAVLSSFGAMLTVVDDQARTPCELAAEQYHPDLASQLEARALLYVDPYGMDDELLAAVMAEQQLPNDDDLDVSESENIAVVKARLSLSAPYLWFKTLNMNDVEKDRKKRLAECCRGMMSHVQAKEEENELKKVMYGMKVEEEEEEEDAGGSHDKANGDESAGNEEETGEKDGDAEGNADGCKENKEGEDNKQEGESLTAESDGGQNVCLSQDSSDSADPSGSAKVSEPKKAPNEDEAANGDPPKQPARKDERLASATTSESSTDEIAEEKDEKVLSDCDVLGLKSIQTAHVAQYLSRHGWIVEKALAAFEERPVKAVQDAGVPLEAIIRAKLRSQSKAENTNDDSISSKVCLICFDEFDIADSDNWTHLVNCSHSFCNECLGDYIADCAQSRSTGLCVPCPHHECDIPMSQTEVKALARTPDTFSMLEKTANDNFVAAATDLRFCPHPGCNGIAKATISPLMKKWGIGFEELQFTGAVCTAVHKENEEPQFQVSGMGPPPITYEGVVDLNTTNCRSTIPPKNAHRFCFGCGEKHHFPVTCESLESWKTKMEEEVEQLKEDGDGPEGEEAYGDIAQRLWMKANTRPCPKCKAPIEKNEGCNHMTCFNPQCKHEFCWICRKDWKLHNTATGGFFRCNRWQDEDNHDFYDEPPPPDQMPPTLSATDAANDEVMNNPEVMAQTYGTAMHATRVAWKKSKEMKRFLHHYTRWNAHMESAALEKLMSENVCTRLAPVVDAAAEFQCDPLFNFDGKGLSFVHAAFKELLECRSVLQHSYAYSFFKFESLAMKRVRHGKRLWNEKAAFEQMQSELEIITEQMSDIVARAHLRATQTQILFLTVGASERRNDFSNLIFTLINEEKKRKQPRVAASSAARRTAASLVASAAAAANLQPLNNASANTLSIQGIARPVNGQGQDGEEAATSEAQQQQQQQAAQETVREALLASLEAFMANTENQPTFVAHVDAETDDGNSDEVDDFDDDDDDDEEDDEQFRSWACPLCTYMNSHGRICAMCGTPAGM